MKHIEIEAIFTAKVKEFIQNGYTINATTMAGSQGEITKIDFRKGNEVFRVMLERTTEWKEDHGTRDVVILTVGRSTENVVHDDRPFDTMGTTFWNNRMEIIEQQKFYQIDCRANYYIEDVAEYDAMQEKQYQRYRNRDTYRSRKDQELPEAARQIAKKYIKRTTGKARVNSQDIKVFKGTNGKRVVYVAEYRGKSYRIG